MIQLPFVKDRCIAVLGLGRSGLVAARALQHSGADVRAWDDSPARRAEAEAAGLPLHDLATADWRKPETLVLSPGIPHCHPKPHPVAAKAREAGCEIIGDIELLGRACPEATYIGITGTNGKSTTTALIGHILDDVGQAPQVGGNLGPPVLAFESCGADGTPFVLEMSSYQLERTAAITFEVAVLLNITPDHLDRHGGFEGYVAAKKAIFTGQGSAHTAIVGVDDPTCAAIHEDLSAQGRQRVIGVSATAPVAGGVYVNGGRLIDDMDGAARVVADLRPLATLPGAHNWQNAAAAYAAARCRGIAPEAIAESLTRFPGLPHRQAIIARIDGVTFVNDSKATNADATRRALASYKEIYWIAGGRAKVGGLAGTESGWDRVRRAFLIGEAAPEFQAALHDSIPAEVSGDLETAVAAAFKRAREDGAEAPVVLLSPACASFDQYPDFEARGAAFARAVTALHDARTGASAQGGAA